MWLWRAILDFPPLISFVRLGQVNIPFLSSSILRERMSSNREKLQFLQEATNVSESICLAALENSNNDPNVAMGKILEMAPDPELERLREEEAKRADAREKTRKALERKREKERNKKEDKARKEALQREQAERQQQEAMEKEVKKQQEMLRMMQEANRRKQQEMETQEANERLEALAAARARKEAQEKQAHELQAAREAIEREKEEQAKIEAKLEAKKAATVTDKIVSPAGDMEELRKYAQRLEEETAEKEDGRADDVFSRHMTIQKKEQKKEQELKELEQSCMFFKEKVEEVKSGSNEQQELLSQLQKAMAELDHVKNELKSLREEKSKAVDISSVPSSSSSSSSSSSPSESSPNVLADVVACPKPPVVSVYIRSDTDQSVTDANLTKIKAIFTLKDIASEDVRVLDVTHDYEFQRYLKERCGGRLPFPVIFIRDHPVGDLNDLLALQNQGGKIDELLKDRPENNGEDASDSSPSSSDLELGFMDKCLNVGEYVVGGVSTMLWLPITIITWPFRSDSTPEKGANDVDIHVIHTNWYWRNLRRIFRFSDDFFARIHPSHLDVRAVHKYDTIEKISLIDSKNIVFVYKDGSSPDYIRATAADIQSIITLVTSRCKGAVVIDKSSCTA